MLMILYRRPVGGPRHRSADPEADAVRAAARAFDLDAVTADDGGMIAVTGDPEPLAAFLLDVRASGIDPERITVMRSENDTELEARFRTALEGWGDEIEVVTAHGG
jgi:hypothetical protein